MYINFWYPICTGEDLGADKPVRAQVLRTRLVAFRDSAGTAHVLSDTCVHRGGSLSKGWVKDDCVICPYHGWRYGSDGRVQLIPSMADSKLPARAKIDAYPTEEKYGIVFAYLGDLPESERSPLYEIENYAHQDWRATGPVIIELDAYYERSMENGLDALHNEYVHPLQGNLPVIMDRLEFSETAWGSQLYAYMEQPDLNRLKLGDLQDKPEDLGAGSSHHGPNTLVTSIDLSSDNNFTQIFFEQPVDENSTRVFFINMRNCMLDSAADAKITEINLNIAGEDIAVLQGLYPIRTPETTTSEILVRGDDGVVNYRKKLKEWQTRGWRIDVKTLRENEGDVAYAIPSPDRVNSGNWVIDSLPLMLD